MVTAPVWSAAQSDAVAAAGGTVVFAHDGAGVAVVRSSAPDFAAQLLASAAIHGVEADQIVPRRLPDAPASVEGSEIDPTNDTFFALQWAPQAIGAPAAWAAGCTGKGVRVAIVDGGLFAAHPDLAANIDTARSASFVAGQAYDADTGTFWNGTHMAGIVAGADNNIGVIGIAPEATLIGVKITHGGAGSFGALIQGILYAATPIAEGGGGADIIATGDGSVFPANGNGTLVSALAKGINYADRHGVLVVSGTGNSGLDLDHSGKFVAAPAQTGTGLGVAATAPSGWALGNANFSDPASYTNYGNSAVWVSAPGGDARYPGSQICSVRTGIGTVTINQPCWVFDLVLSTSRGTSGAGGYAWAAGTDAAASAASAVAAIIKQRNPGISLGALKTMLASTADDTGKAGNDPFSGKGWVNALAACQQ